MVAQDGKHVWIGKGVLALMVAFHLEFWLLGVAIGGGGVAFALLMTILSTGLVCLAADLVLRICDLASALLILLVWGVPVLIAGADTVFIGIVPMLWVGFAPVLVGLELVSDRRQKPIPAVKGQTPRYAIRWVQVCLAALVVASVAGLLYNGRP
jgi:hypothetical protein